MQNRILVWDLPTRIFHWSLVASFTVAFLTAESERWRDIHVITGYTLLGLMGFRLVWGFIGPRHARFANFIKGPQAIVRYLKSLWSGQPEHYVGHNPLGSIAILLFLLLGIGSGLTGWLVYGELGGEWLEELHESVSFAMLAVVCLHILGVLVSSKLNHENLPLAMVTGKKRGDAGQSIPNSRVWVGILLLTAVIGFWTWSWNGMHHGSLLQDVQARLMDGQEKSDSQEQDDD